MKCHNHPQHSLPLRGTKRNDTINGGLTKVRVALNATREQSRHAGESKSRFPSPAIKFNHMMMMMMMIT